MYTNLLWEVIFFSYWSFLIHLQFVYYTAHDHLLLQCWIFLPHLQSHPKINSFDNTVLVYDLNVIPWHHMNHWSSCKHLAMPVKKENDLIRNTGSTFILAKTETGMPKLTLDTALSVLVWTKTRIKSTLFLQQDVYLISVLPCSWMPHFWKFFICLTRWGNFGQYFIKLVKNMFVLPVYERKR